MGIAMGIVCLSTLERQLREKRAKDAADALAAPPSLNTTELVSDPLKTNDEGTDVLKAVEPKELKTVMQPGRNRARKALKKSK